MNLDYQAGLLIGELERNVKSELAKVMNLDDMKARAMEVLSTGEMVVSKQVQSFDSHLALV